MKNSYFLVVGLLFGVVMYKSEAASWFRIYEMFQFDAFHMYGIIGSALTLGVIATQILKRGKFNSIFGTPLAIKRQRPWCNTLSCWGYTLWNWLVGVNRCLSRSIIHPLGSRVFTHTSCNYICPTRYFCLWTFKR